MKKQSQLGMNPSTASGRLVKDLLFSFVVKFGNRCFHCGGDLTRETFSIEHKKPWLDSEDPVRLYFDLENIAFSHQSCNRAAARPASGYSKPNRRKPPHGAIRCYQNGCRCDECRRARHDLYERSESRYRHQFSALS